MQIFIYRLDQHSFINERLRLDAILIPNKVDNKRLSFGHQHFGILYSYTSGLVRITDILKTLQNMECQIKSSGNIYILKI